MEKYVNAVNSILAKWDPIGVGKDIATDEYRGYIPSILKVIEDKQRLVHCLEDILVNKIEVGYDRTNKRHLSDLLAVGDQIIQAYQMVKASK